MVLRVLVQRRPRRGAAGVADADRIGDVHAEVGAPGDALGYQGVAVEDVHGVAVGVEAERCVEGRRTVQRHLGRPLHVGSDDPAGVPAVAAVGRAAEPAVDANLDAHSGASSFLTAAAPASAASRSSACGIRLNDEQPASTYGARNSATSSGVP